MENIQTEVQDHLLIVTMAREKANALNGAMVEELHAAVERARVDTDVRGVVLASDRPKFFSGGFDVAEVFQYDREAMTVFFRRFIDLYEAMRTLPKPIVAAISGHAFAGGAVMALAYDARVMAEGEFGFALNEINLGIVLPPGMIRMAVAVVGVANARQIILGGKAVTATQALRTGLADELARPELVLSRAIALAQEYAGKPPLTFAAIKAVLNELAGIHSGYSDKNVLDQFISHWFSAESKQHREALIASIRR